jgi:HEAT repeat protein
MTVKKLLAVPNDVARFLGSTLRRAENDFKSFSPFKKHRERFSPVFAAKPVLPAHPIEPLPSTPEKTAPVLLAEKKPVSQEVGLRGIRFENKAEQVRAEVYFRDLQSPDRKIRMEAMAEIKKLSLPVVVAVLEQLLSIEHDALQVIEILNALASIGDVTLVPKKLFKNYAEHREVGVRLAALRAISKYRDEESFNILKSCIKDKDAEVRRQVLNCLCWTFGERCLPFAIDALHDAGASVRKAASQITGALKAHQATSGLITLLSDPEKDVQASAAASLKKITGQDFSFRPTASKRHREDAIESWRYWWRENQMKFERSKS